MNTLIEKQIEKEISVKLVDIAIAAKNTDNVPIPRILGEIMAIMEEVAEKREKEVVGEIKSKLSELTQYPASESRTETNYVVLLDQVYKCLPIKEENK